MIKESALFNTPDQTFWVYPIAKYPIIIEMPHEMGKPQELSVVETHNSYMVPLRLFSSWPKDLNPVDRAGRIWYEEFLPAMTAATIMDKDTVKKIQSVLKSMIDRLDFLNINSDSVAGLLSQACAFDLTRNIDGFINKLRPYAFINNTRSNVNTVRQADVIAADAGLLRTKLGGWARVFSPVFGKEARYPEQPLGEALERISVISGRFNTITPEDQTVWNKIRVPVGLFEAVTASVRLMAGERVDWLFDYRTDGKLAMYFLLPNGSVKYPNRPVPVTGNTMRQQEYHGAITLTGLVGAFPGAELNIANVGSAVLEVVFPLKPQQEKSPD